jgi:hypothetical protein
MNAAKVTENKSPTKRPVSCSEAPSALLSPEPGSVQLLGGLENYPWPEDIF